MTRLKSSCLVWSLLLCLVLVNGSMAAPSVAHAAKHGSHTAETHSAGLCAWLCAAGQGVETVAVVFEADPLPASYFVLQWETDAQETIPLHAYLRGPPFSEPC